MASHGVTLGVTKGVKKGVKHKLIASLHLVINDRQTDKHRPSVYKVAGRWLKTIQFSESNVHLNKFVFTLTTTLTAEWPALAFRLTSGSEILVH